MPVLAIVNSDVDHVDHESVRRVVDEYDKFTKRMTTNAARKKRHDGFSQLFDMESDDSEVVRMYKKILKFIYLPALILGIRLNYGWKAHRSARIWFTLGNLAFAWGCFLYTQYVHITSENDKMKIFEVFAVYGIGLSCILKSSNYLSNFKKVQSLLEFMLNVCRQNSTGRRADILKRQLRNLYSRLKAFVACVMVTLVFFVSVPVVAYLANHELIALVPAIIPLVDQTTMKGYLTANSIMSVNGLLGASGTVFCTTLYILLIFNFTMQVELIGDDFRKLDEMWADKEQSLTDKRAFMRNILVRCQDTQIYIIAVKEIFDGIMFAFFGGAYFSQIICLFEITKNSWVPGYCIALLLFQEIMSYCYIGTQKNIANERLCSLVLDTDWYIYDVQSQRMLMMLLQLCQNNSELQIGPLAPMNLSVGVEIIKSIYSYYTILKNVM